MFLEVTRLNPTIELTRYKQINKLFKLITNHYLYSKFYYSRISNMTLIEVLVIKDKPKRCQY